MGKIKELLIKYKELVLYVVFGVLTTVVSYASYWIFTDFLHIPYMVSTALSWVLSVTFAYVTNRKWVFESRAHGFVPILTEAAKFFASRIMSGFMEMGMMFIGVDLLHVNDKIVKLVANVFVILANYILSKLVVFSKKKIPTHGRDSDGEKELTAVAEDPQQHQEQVDEIEIQR